MATGDPDVAAQTARYRDLRRTLEAGVLPFATSLDGRSFRFQAPVGLALRTGCYVALETGGAPLLGQVVDYDLVLEDGPQISGAAGSTPFTTSMRFSRGAGHGVVLGDATPFHDAPVRPARSAEVGAWMALTARPRARLRVGEAMHAPGVAVELDAGGFDRHTFLCGQSGSGKSYSLGVVLEQLLLETDLRIVVLDPNSDCVRLPTVREGADPGLAARWRDLAQVIAVRSAAEGAEHPLHLRFFDLDAHLKAAVVGLDPVGDREEYGTLLDVVADEAAGRPFEQILESLSSGSADARALNGRIRNLGLLGWPLWTRSREEPGLLEDLDAGDWRCLVVDLGSLPSAGERALVAAAVLTRLWSRRADRRPVLVVVDEAHHVCPQDPGDALERVATAMAVRIAAEGRKFGIHLLISTQRPQKVHEDVLSQADNLVLMRMHSSGDLARLAGLFSFVPASLVGEAASLRLGEALVAGKVTPHPVFVRFGGRVAEEGGGDVGASWARPSPRDSP
jgi:hypothetical protein